MAARELTALMAAEIVETVLYPVIFFEAELFASGSPDAQYLRLWTGVGTLSWNGFVWTGGGNLLAISPLEESARTEALGFTVTLSGMPSDKISLALQSVRQGRPGKIWLGAMAKEAYLDLPGVAGNSASTPDAAANRITGDIGVRLIGTPDSFTPASAQAQISKSESAGNRGSWFIRLQTNSRLQVQNSVDGIVTDKTFTSSEVLPITATGFGFDLDVDDGAGNATCDFVYTTDGLTWLALGAQQVSAGTTSLFNSTAAVRIGAINITGNPAAGRYYRAQIYNGIGGTLAVDFDPRRFSSGKLTATMATGEEWTIAQAQSGSPLNDPARVVDGGLVVIADPYLVQQGRFDIVVIEDSGTECTISAQYESRLIDLRRPRTRRYTLEDQQIDFNADTGFAKVAALQDMQLIWGGPGAASAPLAQPDDDRGDSNAGPPGGGGGPAVFDSD